MTKSLLQQVMVKQDKPPVHPIDVAGLTEKIQSGYTVNRIDKQTQKKTFAPSTILDKWERKSLVCGSII